MTKWEVVRKIATKNNMYSPTIVSIVLNELETMGLIKFETEREAVIKEAERYTGNGEVITMDNTSFIKLLQIIKSLLALVKQ